MKKLSRGEIEALINVRAWKEPSFKQHLISNPRDALRELGVESQSLRISVIEELEKEWCLVLHPAPKQYPFLSIEELLGVLNEDELFD
jgi:hypothetical protein